MLGLGIDLFRFGGGGSADVPQLFNAVTYTGNGTSQAITGVGFQPDFVWIKQRNFTASHQLQDSVRGTGKILFSNDTSAEVSHNTITSFDSDGFTAAVDGVATGTNAFGGTYVAWCWKAGGTAVTNTDGSITSQVSANVGAGFSIVSWTGTGGGADTIGHGLNDAPEFIITKTRTASVAYNWNSYHVGVDSSAPEDYFISLNTTNARAYYTTADCWNRTKPTNSVFSVNHVATAGPSGDEMIAYCFHSVEGFSKIGTYSGTGSDQAITGLGFQPDFVLIKRTDSTGNWCIADSARLTSGESNFLYPNLNNAESVSAVITMESDGFSMDGAGVDYNASGGTYLYMAIKGPA